MQRRHYLRIMWLLDSRHSRPNRAFLFFPGVTLLVHVHLLADSLIPIHCFCFCFVRLTLTLERSTGRARRGGLPVSSYRFGPPGRDSVYYTPPMGRIGVHHPREIVRVERDYTGGEIVQFTSVYPLELEGRVRLSTLSYVIVEISLYVHADHASAVHGKHQCYQRDTYIGL